MKQLQRIYVTEKQFRHKQSQKGAKFTHKINKIAIDTSRARHNALTYTMTHYKAVYELNLYELTVKKLIYAIVRALYNWMCNSRIEEIM